MDYGEIALGLFIAVLVFSAGCTQYFSNLTAPKSTLPLDQPAEFDSNGQQFTVTIDHIAMSSPSPDSHTMTVHLTARNTGKNTFSLVAYPRLSDTAGNEYAGNAVYLYSLFPGGMASGESTISIGPKDAYAALKNGATLEVRLQGGAGSVWEAGWDVDKGTL